MKQPLDKIFSIVFDRVLWSIVLLLTPSLAAAQISLPSEGRAKFREAITLDLDSQVIKALATAQDHVAEQNWAQAIPLLQQLIESQGDELVPLELGRYWNAADLSQAIIARFPSDALKLYRDRVDPLLKNVFEAGKRELDEQQLRRVVQAGFNSSYGDDALWILGELAFERGDFALARTTWELLIPEQPRADQAATKLATATGELTYLDPDYPAAEVAARLVLCSIFAGQFELADRELPAFQKMYPQAKGHLAGEDGDFAEILARWRSKATKWKSQQATASDWPTVGGDNTRNRESSAPSESLGLRWSAVLPNNPFVGRSPRIALHERPPLSFLPVVADGAVFVSGPDSVHAFDLLTGKPHWPTNDKDPSRIFTSVGEAALRPTLETVGVPYYSLTVDNGRLFTRLGPPIVRRSRNETHTVSEIFGFDLRTEGQLIFQQAASALDGPDVSPEATGWSFEGTPVVDGNRLWVSARRGFPEEEIELACFDVESRQLLWRRRLCAVLRNNPEHYNVMGHRLLTLSDGRLIVETSAGAIAALDAETGRVLWLVAYEVIPREDLPIDLNDPRRHGLVPCVAAEGLVFAAPTDSNMVFCLDAATGRIIWQYKIGDRIQHLLGVVDGRLIASGRQLWALSVQNGRPVWPEQRVGSDDPRGHGYGRGVIAGWSIYWPLREEIWRVDVRTGALQARHAIQQALGETGGNLVIANGILLIAQGQRLVALGEPIVVPPAASPQVGSKASAHDTNNLFAVAPVPRKQAAHRIVSAQATQSPWPVRRTWSLPLKSTERVLAPVSVEPAQPLIGLIQDADSVRAIEVMSHDVVWTGNTPEQIRWTATIGGSLLVADAFFTSARELKSGRQIWKTALPSNTSASQFEHRLLVAEATGRTPLEAIILSHNNEQLQAIDAATGRVLWQIALSSNATRHAHIPPLVELSERSLFFRPAHAAGAGRLDLLRGSSSHASHIPPHCRKLLTVVLDDATERLLVLSDDHKLTGWSGDGTLGWTCSDRISVAFHLPELRRAGDIALLIEDGLFARRIDPRSGERLWSRPLSKQPLVKLDESLKVTNEGLVSLGSGVLQRIRLTDGSVSWRHYLGAGDWCLETSSGDLTTAVALQCGKNSTRVTVCEEATGELIQTLELPATQRPQPLKSLGNCLLFASHDTLVGLESVP